MSCFVYLIGSDSDDVYKVGITDDVGRRLRELQAASPVHLRVFDKWCLPDRNAAFAVEQGLHRRHGESRMHGEWFGQPLGIIRGTIWDEVVVYWSDVLKNGPIGFAGFLVSVGMTWAEATDFSVIIYGSAPPLEPSS